MSERAKDDGELAQATLSADTKPLPSLDCRLYGGLCGNDATHVVDISGNQYADSDDPVFVCGTCLNELKEAKIDSHRPLTEREVWELAD